MSNRTYRLTPEVLLRAYAAGLFPMAENAQAKELRWFDPPLRGVIPLDWRFHVSRRLRRTILKRPFEIRLNTAFRDVIRLCAEPTAARNETWINDEIAGLYTKLYEQGHAHSVEAFYEGKLVGGLYGVSLGGAFFGESMFSRRTDASKIALVYLVALLRHGGFTLLDAQFQTEHLAQFGAMEITRSSYQHLLEIALEKKTVLSPPSSFENGWDDLVESGMEKLPSS